VVLVINFSIGVVEAKEKDFQVPSSSNFPSTPLINNPYNPLVPGTTFVYRPVGEDNVVNTVEVTNDTKVIIGVTCVVVHDYEMVNGVL